VIVVIGSPAWRTAPTPVPAGRACGIALAAVARGARVELVGRVGDDPAGDALLIALANAGVGHAAILRDPTRPTLRLEIAAVPADDDETSLFADPVTVAAPVPDALAPSAGPRLDGADIDLAIRYLEPSGVLVVADDVPSDVLAAAAEAVGYAQMHLVVLLAPGGLAARSMPAGIPPDATVLAAPDDGDDAGAFEALVGAYAAALDGGAAPAAAFIAAQSATGWEAAAAD
jgi:hypothetical protein